MRRYPHLRGSDEAKLHSHATKAGVMRSAIIIIRTHSVTPSI